MTYKRLEGHHFKSMICANEGCKKNVRVPYTTMPNGFVYCSRSCYEKR